MQPRHGSRASARTLERIPCCETHVVCYFDIRSVEASVPSRGDRQYQRQTSRRHPWQTDASMAKISKSEKVPESMQTTFGTIVEPTDVFCQECRNAEHVQRSRQVTAALYHTRPSPLQQGRIHAWACGIILCAGIGQISIWHHSPRLGVAGASVGWGRQGTEVQRGHSAYTGSPGRDL
jgi:hypothetical protein